MPDGTKLNAPSVPGGDDIFTDEITDGGVAQGFKAQGVKLGVGVDGEYRHISDADPMPIADPWIAHALKLIPGQEPVHVFGENPDIDGAFETITDIGGTYLPPTQARVHDVASTDPADAGTVLSSGTATGGSLIALEDTGATFASDGVAVGDLVLNDISVAIAVVTGVSETQLDFVGRIRNPGDGFDCQPVAVGDAYRVVTNASTGASLVYITGGAATFLALDTFVVLNGATPVPTTVPFVRQNTMRAFGPNTTGAVGVITSTAQVDGTVSIQIIDGNNQSLHTPYSVPVNKTGLVKNWWGSISKRTAAISTIHIRAGTLGGMGYVLQSRVLNSVGTSGFEYEWKPYLVVSGGVDIWIEADTDSANTGVAAGYDILLVDPI